MPSTDKRKSNKGKPEDKPRKVGKPPINDPADEEAIQGKIDAYFEKCLIGETRPTYCGLAIALDYSSRQSLWENSKSNTAISLPIKKALLKIEETYEQGLASNACTGSIFALKNRGWQDKSEVEHSGGLLTGNLTQEELDKRLDELEQKRKVEK